MATNQGQATDHLKATAEQIWLNYFNRVLYEQGVITEAERNQMKLKIAKRKKTNLTR